MSVPVLFRGFPARMVYLKHDIFTAADWGLWAKWFPLSKGPLTLDGTLSKEPVNWKKTLSKSQEN